MRVEFRQMIWEAYGYETHEPAVQRFHDSDANAKIVSCPARTSKSYAGWKDVLPDIHYHGALLYSGVQVETQIVWIVAPNFDLAKEFDYAWEDLVERREALGFDYQLVRSTKSPGQGNMVIQIRWGKNLKGQDVDTIVVVKSAANEKSLQSEEVDIAILSEAARLDEVVWSKYLSTRVGRSVWPTTPDIAAAWIYREIERGKKNPSLGIENFQFTPRANPHYNYKRYWIEHQKAELRVNSQALLTLPADENAAPSDQNGHDCFNPLTDCSAMRDLGFAEQFGGQWTFQRGRVVPLRTTPSPTGDPSHIVETELPWFDYADVHVAMDYGYTDPAVIGFWLVGPHQVVLRRSVYERGLTPDQLVDRYDTIVKEMKWKGRITRIVGDPKKPEIAQTFRLRGLPIWDVNKGAQADRKAGHLELMNFLSTNPHTGQPYMLIHQDNPEVIDEFSTLRYNEKVRDPNAPSALIGRDDAYDMSRYFVMTRPPVEMNEAPKLERTDFDKMRQTILRQKNRKPTRTVGQRSGLMTGGHYAA